MKKWRAYERLVALLSSNEYEDSLTVIPNARVTGLISKRKRQIDILIDYRFNVDLNRRIIIDAKDRKRPIDIKDVESFEGLMKDVCAKRGILVCANGYTKASLRRAQENIGIRIISSDEIDNLDFSSWDNCLHLKCKNGLVLWDAAPGVIVEGTVIIHFIGKCDECGKFHVWCCSCGNRKVLEIEDDWQCACQGPWFWLTSIEKDEDTSGYVSKGSYLLLIMGDASYDVVDRRPM